VWRRLGQSLIDDAVDQWPTRLRACVRVTGGHFEHSLPFECQLFVFSVLDEIYVLHRA